MHAARTGAAVFVSLALTFTFGMPTPARAYQGFSVYEHSACTAGRGGAAVAAPCADGSAIQYNPAGIAGTGRTVTLGGAVISLDATFTPDEGAAVDQQAGLAYTGHAYATLPLGERLAIGIGAFAPYGLTLEWPADFRGAFSGSRGDLVGLYIQPTAAMRLLPWLDVGAGVDFVWTSVKLDQALDLSTVTATEAAGGPVTFGDLGIPTATRFGDAALQGSTWSNGWHLGALVRVNDALSLGVRYMARVRNTFEQGEARFTQVPTGIVLPDDNGLGVPGGTPLDALLAPQFEPGGPLDDQSASTVLTLPAQLVVGGSAVVSSRVRLYFDYAYTYWSAYREVRLDFAELETEVLIQDFEDVGTVRVGGEVDVAGDLVVRLGISHNQPAAPDETVTPLLPDSRRTGFNVGAGTSLPWNARLDAYGIYTLQADRRGRLLPRPSRSISAEELNEGVFSGGAIDLGLTLSFRW